MSTSREPATAWTGQSGPSGLRRPPGERSAGVGKDFECYDDDDHGSVPLIAEYDALRFVFDGYRLPLRRVIAQPDLLTEHFEGVSERLGQTFRPSEGMMRLLTQVALGQDTTTAIAFGELRVRLFPESFRAYEELGDLWAERGDVETARRYYEQALVKSPGNAAIRQKLTGLGG